MLCSPIENSGPKDLPTNDRDIASGFSPVHNRDFSVDERKDEFYRGPSFANENRSASGQYSMAYGVASIHLDDSDSVSR